MLEAGLALGQEPDSGVRSGRGAEHEGQERKILLKET